jgi:hypothetical protein
MIDVKLDASPQPLPAAIAAYLAVAQQRVGDFYARHASNDTRGFVPSDYVKIYHALQAIQASNLACGAAFCEWGSGLGIVASLAAMAGFEACGIEIDRELFDESEELADEFKVDVDFVHGSFVPLAAEAMIDLAYQENDGELRLTIAPDSAYDELGQEIADFDVIFAFPWPNDEALTARMFERFAADGALLLTYCETDFVRLRRK